MGYETDRFPCEIDEELICSICFDVMEDPMQIPGCEHTFCAQCINHWLKQNSHCPIDRKKVPQRKLQRSSKLLNRLLGRLVIICDNAKHGCNEIVKLDELNDHLKKCNFDPAHLPNKPQTQSIQNSTSTKRPISSIPKNRNKYIRVQSPRPPVPVSPTRNTNNRNLIVTRPSTPFPSTNWLLSDTTPISNQLNRSFESSPDVSASEPCNYPQMHGLACNHVNPRQRKSVTLQWQTNASPQVPTGSGSQPRRSTYSQTEVQSINLSTTRVVNVEQHLVVTPRNIQIVANQINSEHAYFVSPNRNQPSTSTATEAPFTLSETTTTTTTTFQASEVEHIRFDCYCGLIYPTKEELELHKKFMHPPEVIQID